MRDCVDQVSPWAWLRGGFLGYFNGGEKIYSLWGALFSGQGVLDCLKQAGAPAGMHRGPDVSF